MSPPIIISGTVPHWINTKTERVLVSLVESLLTTCGITSKVTLVFQKEASIQKRKHQQPCSITLRPSSFNNPTSLTVLAVGKNPGHDMAEIILNLSQRGCDLLRARLTEGPFSINPPTEPPVNSAPPAQTSDSPPSAPEFDDTALALFLADMRAAGGTEDAGCLTRGALKVIAERLTGSDIVISIALSAGLIEQLPGIYTLYCITRCGKDLLKKHIDPPSDATKPAESPSQPAPSEFDRLKAAVRDARAQHQAAKAQHDARAQARTNLTHQLTEAREALQSEELNATTLQGRLQKLQQDLTSAQCRVTGARRHVLDLEEQARALGTDTPDLIQAERTLKEAETAYAQLIAL